MIEDGFGTRACPILVFAYGVFQNPDPSDAVRAVGEAPHSGRSDQVAEVPKPAVSRLLF